MESNGLPISIIIGPANQHDSTRFIDVMDSISNHLDNSTTNKIKSVYADKGYDGTIIRNYLKSKNIIPCIPKRNYKTKSDNQIKNQNNNYNKTRFVVERFFAWLKCGFHRARIRYEIKSENYLAFVYLASIMMYWRVLG